MTNAKRKQVVEDELDRLETEYGSCEHVEKSWSVTPEAYQQFADRFETGAIGGAGVWITNEDGEVLLVRNEGDDGWSDPGGKAEPGESFAEAAVREVEEETGVQCAIDGLLQIHVIEIVDDSNSHQPPLFDLIAIFEGSYVEGEPERAVGEIADVRWWDRHPEQLLYEELADFPVPAAEQ